MAEGKRFWLFAMQKNDMWCRWKAGRGCMRLDAGSARVVRSIRCVVSHHGGLVPAVRQRSLLALTGDRVNSRQDRIFRPCRAKVSPESSCFVSE
jgi:hypothetical protein